VNKSELIDAVASAADISRTAAGRAVDGLTDAIGDALSKGDQVTLVGFGTFSVRERAERKGRNPQTGEEITIKAAKIPSFKAGKGLKDTIK
jgi:DNA-binding protein HU-beta